MVNFTHLNPEQSGDVEKQSVVVVGGKSIAIVRDVLSFFFLAEFVDIDLVYRQKILSLVEEALLRREFAQEGRGMVLDVSLNLPDVRGFAHRQRWLHVGEVVARLKHFTVAVELPIEEYPGVGNIGVLEEVFRIIVAGFVAIKQNKRVDCHVL